MTRCPNCGSAIRIGAKFCTSCGFRLATEESTTSPARSPFATTSNAPWSAPGEASPPLEPLAASPDDEPTAPAWSKADADDDEVVLASDSGTVDLHDQPDTDDNHRPGPSWYAPPPADTSGPVSDDMIASLGGDGTAQLESDIAEESGQDALVTSASTASWPRMAGTSSGEEDEADVMGSVTSELQPDSDDPLAEARALTARLADVLASVHDRVSMSGATTGSPSVVSSIADEGDVESLRTIVQSARERPKDIDVMLDLVLRADTIAAVLADRDQLLAALAGGTPAGDDTQTSDDTGSIPASSGWGQA